MHFSPSSSVQWIKWDDMMVDAETLTRTIAHTSTLTEDLGQIEYVLTDKTGEPITLEHAPTKLRAGHL